MRISKRILAIALSVLMAFSMMPFTAFAASPTAAQALAPRMDDGKVLQAKHLIYAGKEWIVVGVGDTGVQLADGAVSKEEGETTLVLLAWNNWSSSYVKFANTDSNDYATSNLRTLMEGYVTSESIGSYYTGNQAWLNDLVAPRTLEGGATQWQTGWEGWQTEDKILGTTITNATLWPMSAAEWQQVYGSVMHPNYMAGDNFWLRTPAPVNGGYVRGTSAANINQVNDEWVQYNAAGVRPALCLNVTDDMFVTQTEGSVEQTYELRKHDFGYTASGATLTAQCSSSVCELNGETFNLTISASDKDYDGSAYAGASISDTTDWTAMGLAVPTIQYEGTGSTTYAKSATAPTEAGTYVATISAGGATASAAFNIVAIDPVSYKNAAYDSATNTVTYTDATCDDYTVVAADTTTFEDGKWYVVNSNVTVNGSITVNGAANLILADGYILTVTEGVAVTDPSSLTIFGQENGTGTLTATGVDDAAGIGGIYGKSGPITINGGTINATGDDDGGAGIGASDGNSCGNITINGGTVNASASGSSNMYVIGDAGWGSSGDGTIAIHGGTVNVNPGEYAYGIGYSGNGTINITGGVVNVNKDKAWATGFKGGNLNVSGGEVYAAGSVAVMSNANFTGGTFIAESLRDNNPAIQSSVSIASGLKVLLGSDEASAVEVEPSFIDYNSSPYWNANPKWIKIYPAPPIKPDGFNLTVEDKVKMNLYINVDDYTDPAEATVTVTYNDPEAQAPTPKTDTYSGEALAALKDADDGRYVIPVLAAPAQIRDDVTVTVTDRAEPITTNVATYCETIIAQSEDAELVALAKAILDYGKACSAEFNYNVDGFEEQAYYNTDDVSYILDEEAKLNSADANGKFAGYSYIAKAVPALRIYLNTTEAEVVANDLKATVNGTEVTPKVEEGTGRVCVDITGILAEDLDVMQTVEFNGGTLKLNALQYAKAKGGNTDFSRSMCEYWFYAHTYFK